MSTKYIQARAEVHEMAREILEKHHPHLRMGDGAHVRLCIMMAFNENRESGEAPLKLNGYPCAGQIRVIPYKQRVDKRADAEILLDESYWDNATEPQQRALLDHEITHLEIEKDENGFVKTDDVGRPKLKLKLHDWQLGGFRSIAERYGSDAPEVIEARKFDEKFGECTTSKASLFA